MKGNTTILENIFGEKGYRYILEKITIRNMHVFNANNQKHIEQVKDKVVEVFKLNKAGK